VRRGETPQASPRCRSHRAAGLTALQASPCCRSHRAAGLTALQVSPCCRPHRAAGLTALQASPCCRSHRATGFFSFLPPLPLPSLSSPSSSFLPPLPPHPPFFPLPPHPPVFPLTSLSHPPLIPPVVATPPLLSDFSLAFNHRLGSSFDIHICSSVVLSGPSRPPCVGPLWSLWRAPGDPLWMLKVKRPVVSFHANGVRWSV